MSDSESNPPRHGARWSDQQKRRVMQLRRSGQKYEDIATTMGRTKNSVKSMCERLERAQFSDNEQNTNSKQWNDRLLSINAPLIKQQQQQQNENKKAEDETQETDTVHSAESNTASLSNQQQIPWPAHDAVNNNQKENELKQQNETSQITNCHTNTTENSKQQTEQSDTKMDVDQPKKNEIEPNVQTASNVLENAHNEAIQTQHEQLQTRIPTKSNNTVQNEQTDDVQTGQTQQQPKLSQIEQSIKGSTSLDSDRDSDCVIISVSSPSKKQIVATTEKRSIHKSKSTPIGHQGSDIEYKRLIQKYGQSMRYTVNETVIYFVPRLAQRGRFKDRIGRILSKMDDSESKYQIVDTQNNKKEIVPWKWILKKPPPPHPPIAKQQSPTTTNSVEQIPMHSLSSKEEKLQEFDRRMKRMTTTHCKQYSVPLNDSSSYYDDYSDHRGRSLQHKLFDLQHNHKGKQIRSLSVFPQRLNDHHQHHHKKQKLYSPPPPLQRDKVPKFEKKVIDIASDDAVDIKKEKIKILSDPKLSRRSKRSRSRSPSHIRPSNRIINRSLNPNPSSRYAPLHGFVEPFDPYKIDRLSRYDYDRLYYRDDRGLHQRKCSPNKRSRSRSRSRERDRDRDRNRNYYHREYTPPHYQYDDRRNYTPPHHRSYHHAGDQREAVGDSRLMRSWLAVVDRMRGGSKLREREIAFLCKNDVWPSQIKQLMDSDKSVQEKYDLVAHYLDPSNGQNLSRSQIYSIIGAVITMKF